MPKQTAINLARGRRESYFDRFVTWALTVGRAIVIFTEIVALLAFLYRFTLDRQIIELHSKIKQEQTVVKLLNKNEMTYRNLQERLALIQQLAPQAETKTKLMEAIYAAVPDGMALSQVLLSAGTIQVDASLQVPQALSTFTKNLKQLPEVKKITVTRVENKTSQATILVGLSITTAK